MQPIIKDLQKELSKNNTYLDPFFINRSEHLLDTIKNNYSKGKILEVGSYPFYILWMLKKLNYDITGLDLGPPYEKTTENFIKNNKIKFSTCNILKDKFPFKNETFSMAILTEVIEHLANPLNALIESNRVLEKNGILILSTPNLHSIGKIIKYFSGIGFERKVYMNYEQELVKGYPGHIREFSYFELKSLIERAGFKVEKVSFEYFSLPKKDKLVIPFYLLIPFLRPFQFVIARKKKDYLAIREQIYGPINFKK